MKMIYEQIFFLNIYFIKHVELKQLENQSHKSKQVVLQIWGWYLKKLVFGKIRFGRISKRFLLDALLVYTAVGFVIHNTV